MQIYNSTPKATATFLLYYNPLISIIYAIEKNIVEKKIRKIPNDRALVAIPHYNYYYVNYKRAIKVQNCMNIMII